MWGRKNNNIILRSFAKGLIAMLFVILIIFLIPILLVTSFINSDIESAETVSAAASEVTANRSAAGMTGYKASDLATDTSWIDGLDENFYDEAMITEDVLRYMLDCEKDSYASEVKILEVTYMDPRYELVEINSDNEDGVGKNLAEGDNAPYTLDFMINGKHYRLIRLESVEEVRRETFDLREMTFEYRLQWQIIYAIAKAIEQEEKISQGTVQKIYDQFKTVYDYEYDYYNNSKTSYTYSELEVLPHKGYFENYSPIGILNKVETLFYDYTYNVTRNDLFNTGFSHQMGAVTATFNPVRFEEGMKNLGCNREDIEYFIELLDGMGCYNDLVSQLCNAYDIIL